jgi:hypothetical protein
MVGTGISAVLIEYSQILAYFDLAIVFGFTGFDCLQIEKGNQNTKTWKFK